MAEDEGFLSRWSRRKSDVRRGGATAEPESGAPPGGVDATAAPGTGARKALTEADFADVDFSALDAASDYKRFIDPAVPDAIRNRALARLWASDPVLSAPDPFSDCAGDFTDAARAVTGGLLQTAHKIGQGFLSDQEAAEWERLGRPPAVAAEDGPVGTAAAPPSTAAPDPSPGPGSEARRAARAVLAALESDAALPAP